MVNIQDLLFIFTQGFSGAVAGYITNKYAVNMIFKEYTPLKIGGAVKKNKVKFIEEVSELVEKDIINSQTLRGSIESEDFARVIDAACVDFMTNSLNDAFKGVKIKHIPAISNSAEQCVTFIEQNLQEELPKLIDNLSNKIEIKNILQKDQLDSISTNIVELIVDVLETDNKLEEFLACLYDENKDITFGEILSDEATVNLTEGISNVLNDSINSIIDDEQQCLQLLEKVYELLDLTSVISKLQTELGQKTLLDILGEEGLKNINGLLFEHIKNLAKDDANRDRLNQIISELLAVARDMDVTLFEILPEELANSIVSYIKDIIPDLAPHISNWLYENKDKIDTVINSAVGETVDQIEDESIKGMIEKFAGMLSSISQTLKVVDRASDMVMKYELTPEASNKIYIAIMKFLEDTTIGDIVSLLEDKLNIKEEVICDKLIDLFEANGDVLIEKLISSFKERQISELVKIDLEPLFKSKAIPWIYRFIKSNKTKINLYLHGAVDTKVEQILSNKIGDMISVDKITLLSKKLPKIISKYLVNNKNICKSYIEKLVINSLDSVDFENIILNNKEKLILLICNKFTDLKQFIFDELKDKEIDDVLDLIKDKEGLGLSLGEKLHKGLVNNVEQVIDNNVKKIIYNNLIKLNEDEICDIAQSFMGKQLKPLSYFGALLGAVAGLIFAFVINGTINSFGFYNGYLNTIMACVLMGLVGVLTNVIALWMIFHPYKKNEFVAKIPVFRIFAQGYIPAHKDGFASGMAYFIDNELLKGKRVESLFNSKKDSFSETIFNWVSNNNFKVLVDIAGEKKNNISEFLYQFIIDKCNKNKAAIAKSLSKTSENIEIGGVLTKERALSASQSFLSNLDRFDDAIIKFAQAKIDKQQKLNDLLPQALVESINNDINKSVDDSVKTTVDKMLKEEVVRALILNKEDIYKAATVKTIDQLVGYENISKVKSSIENNLNSYIIKNLPNVLENSLDKFLQNQLSEDKSIGEIFGGKIKVTLDKNLYSITSALLSKACDYVQENKEQVISLVVGLIKGQLNFFIKMAYDFINGDRLVGLVVENIIDTKLEGFLSETTYSTIKTISVCTNSVIYPTTMGELGLYSQQINTNVVVEALVGDIKENKAIFDNVNQIALSAVDEFKNVKVSDIVEGTNIETLEGVYNLFEQEVALVLNSISGNYNDNVEDINNFMNTYISDNITAKVLDQKLDTILDVDDVISVAVKSILDKLDQSTKSRELLLQSIEAIYDSRVSNMKLNDLLEQEFLNSGLEEALDRLFKDLDFNENNQYIVDKIVSNCIESEFKFIDIATKEYIVKNVIDALLTTGIGFTVDAMKALKLKEITTEQVEIMDPREIHMLFKSFAGDFFVKLYLYGSMGAVFGINIYLSIILGIADLFYSKKIDQKEISTDNIFKE